MGHRRRRQLEHRGFRHRHQRQSRQDDQLQDQHEFEQLPHRHLPARLLRRHGRAQGRHDPAHRRAEPAEPAARCRDRPGRRRQLGRLGLLGRAGGRRLGRLHRQARAPGRHLRREPDPVHRARRLPATATSSSRPRTRPGRPITAGVARTSTAATARDGPGRRTRLRGQLQPADRDARRRRNLCRPAGLSLRRRVRRDLVAGAERLRRLLHGRRRCRPLRQPAPQPQDAISTSVTTSTGRASSAPTSRRPATPASICQFWSGNEVYWRTRWGNSISSDATPYRTLISYKETWAERQHRSDQPVDRNLPRSALQSRRRIGGGSPENALTGTALQGRRRRREPRVDQGPLRRRQPALLAQHERRQSPARPDGDADARTISATNGTNRPTTASIPAGLVKLSSTTLPVTTYLLDYGNTTGNGDRDPQSHALPRSERRPGLRRRHGLLVLGPERQPRQGGDADRPPRAAGDGQPVRRHGHPAGDAAIRTDHRRRRRRTSTAPTSAITSPGSGATLTAGSDRHHYRHGLGRRRRHRGRRGLDRQRRELASGDGRRELDLHLVAAGRRHLHDPHPAPSTTASTWRRLRPGARSPSAAPNYVSLFPGSAVPAIVNTADASAVELGVQVPDPRSPARSAASASTRARQDIGTHTGSLWSSTGTKLATAHLRERDRERLADGDLLQPGHDDGEPDLHRLLSHQCRPLFQHRQLLHGGRDERSADGAGGRQRRLHLRQHERVPDEHVPGDELLGRRDVQSVGRAQSGADGRERSAASPRRATRPSRSQPRPCSPTTPIRTATRSPSPASAAP